MCILFRDKYGSGRSQGCDRSWVEESLAENDVENPNSAVELVDSTPGKLDKMQQIWDRKSVIERNIDRKNHSFVPGDLEMLIIVSKVL